VTRQAAPLIHRHRAKREGRQATNTYIHTHNHIHSLILLLVGKHISTLPVPHTFTMAGGASAARKTWELENRVAIVDPAKDNIYGFDKTEQEALRDAQPWKKE